MSAVFLIIRIDDTQGAFQYALETENGNLEQLSMLNAMVDIAKQKIVNAMDHLAVSEERK